MRQGRDWEVVKCADDDGNRLEEPYGRKKKGEEIVSCGGNLFSLELLSGPAFVRLGLSPLLVSYGNDGQVFHQLEAD